MKQYINNKHRPYQCYSLAICKWQLCPRQSK